MADDLNQQIVNHLLDMELGEMDDFNDTKVSVEKTMDGSFVVWVDGFKTFHDDVNRAADALEDELPDDIFEDDPDEVIEATYEITVQLWESKSDGSIPTDDDVRQAMIEGLFRRGFNDLAAVNVKRL